MVVAVKLNVPSSALAAGAARLTVTVPAATIRVLARAVPRRTWPAVVATPVRLTDSEPAASPAPVPTVNVALDAPAAIVAVPEAAPPCQVAVTAALPSPPSSRTV